MSDQGTYQVEMHCINCEKGVSVDIPRGVRVADFAGECPRCGCVEVLSRIAKMKPLPNRFDPNQHEWRPPIPFTPSSPYTPFVTCGYNSSPPHSRIVEVTVARGQATLDRLEALARSHSSRSVH